MLDTGFPQADAENDFLRARRHQFLAALTNRLRGRPVNSGRLVPLDEIVGSLGWRGQRQLGLQTIRLDTIVGTAGARRDFDRCFRPTSGRVRSRWERLALAQRRGAVDPADRGLPRGPSAFRQRWSPSGIYRRCDRSAADRRLRDPGAHHGAAPDPDRQPASLLALIAARAGPTARPNRSYRRSICRQSRSVGSAPAR